MGSPLKLINELVVQVAHDSGAVTESENFATFDRLDASGVDNALHEFVCLIDTGLWTTDKAFRFHLEESTDESDWTDVDVSEVVFGDGQGDPGTGIVSGNDILIDGLADDNEQYLLGYMGDARWVRLAVDVTGTTGDVADVVIVYLGAGPRDMVR
jgi:hypothetical protein